MANWARSPTTLGDSTAPNTVDEVVDDRLATRESHWNDPFWQLEHSPHTNSGSFRINWWNQRVGNGTRLTSTSPAWVPPLLETARHFAWYLLYQRDDGSIASTTVMARMSIFTRFLEFLTVQRDCIDLEEATLDDVDAFVEHRIAEISQSHGYIPRNPIIILYASLLDLSAARTYMKSQGVQYLSFELWPGFSPDKLAQLQNAKEPDYVHAVPEPAGRQIINCAYRFLDSFTVPISKVLGTYQEVFTAHKKSSHRKQFGEAEQSIRKAFGELLDPPTSLQPDVEAYLRNYLTQGTDPVRLLVETCNDLVAAATIVIQALTGARIGEVLQLRTTTIVREISSDGRWYLYFLRVYRSKSGDGWTRILAGICPTTTRPPDHESLDVLQHPDAELLPLPVRAVVAMRVLRSPTRTLGLLPNGKAEFLFPMAHRGDVVNFKKSAMRTHQALAAQNHFIRRRPDLSDELDRGFEELADLLDLDEVPRKVVTHSWRKWFTEAVIAYDQYDEDFPEVQRQLGHIVGSIVTRVNYASGGIEYRQFTDNVFQERAARAMLSALEGRTRATGPVVRSLLENRDAILNGLDSKSLEIRVRAVRLYLEEMGVNVVAAANNSGICAYRADRAKCWNSLSGSTTADEDDADTIPGRDWLAETGTAPLGPNRSLARSSLCRQCANFMLTEDQVAYWVNAADELNRLAIELERQANPTNEDLYEAHAHRSNAADYLTFVDNTIRRMVLPVTEEEQN